ncbi:MAG: hypothetical protein LBQ43_01760 [Holosporales bacterium]|jgi:hypothetical protein|nr:hypothetical protein [Holosporales bacterium]
MVNVCIAIVVGICFFSVTHASSTALVRSAHLCGQAGNMSPSIKEQQVKKLEQAQMWGDRMLVGSACVGHASSAYFDVPCSYSPSISSSYSNDGVEKNLDEVSPDFWMDEEYSFSDNVCDDVSDDNYVIKVKSLLRRSYSFDDRFDVFLV